MRTVSTNRLTVTAVKALAEGLHADGGGLYCAASKSGAKSWRFVWRAGGKRREMGLGSFPAVTLAKARERAAEARAQLAGGVDPIAARKAERPVPTFGEAADRLIADLGPQWRNAKHRAQWAMTLSTYCGAIRERKVSEIETADVLAVLQPVWLAKPETAARLRGRIERVLDAARARDEREGENPARWRGHLDHLLPARQKLTRGHHAAMAYADLPAFVAELREREALAALALEFLILTAARSGEALGARWDEIDLDARVWTVPAARMKAGVAHRVPLTDRALAILEAVAPLRGKGDLVFPGQRPGRPLSGMAFEMLLRRMGREGVTPHGFRSTFRDWAAEETSFAREIAEQALAHTVGDATERAYRRGDALERRRQLMMAWAAHCEPAAPGNVVPMRRA